MHRNRLNSFFLLIFLCFYRLPPSNCNAGTYKPTPRRLLPRQKFAHRSNISTRALMMENTEKANLFDSGSFAQLSAWGRSCKEPSGRVGRVQTAVNNEVPGTVSARGERVGAQKPPADVSPRRQGQHSILHRIGVHLRCRPAGSTAPSGHH